MTAIGVKDPQYHLVAFIMKASVWANVLEEGQETSQTNNPTGQEKGKKGARKGQEKLLALIKENPYISISSKAKEWGMSVKAIRNMIDELRNSHLVNTSGVRSEILWNPQILKSPVNLQKIREECLLRWGKFVILHADYYQAGLKTCKSACWLRGSLAGLRTFQACRSRFLII